MRSLLLLAVALLGAAGPLLGLAVFACVPNPSIDGSRVRPIGLPDAPASCDLLCERLGKLCGFPPLDCTATCDAEYDLVHKSCLGVAASCQEALEVCANEELDAAADAEAATDAGEDGESELDGAIEGAAISDASDSS